MCLCLLVASISCGRARPSAPAAERGVIDLRASVLDEVPLAGAWGFLPGVLVQEANTPAAVFLKVPAAWNGQTVGGSAYGPHGAGTYILRVLLPPAHEPLALKMLSCSSACRVFVSGSNGVHEVYSAGQPALTPDRETGDYRPGVVRLPPTGDRFDILVQVSNFEHNRGGLWRTPVLGTESRLNRTRSVTLYWDFFLVGALLMMGAYHLGISFMRGGNPSSRYLGLFCALMALRTGLTGEMSVLEAFPGLPWSTRLTLEYADFNVALAVFVAYATAVFPKQSIQWLRKIEIAGALVLAAVALATPSRFFTGTLVAAQIWLGLCAADMLVSASRAAWKQFGDARLFLAGFVVLFAAVLNDIFYSWNLSPFPYLSPLGFFIFIAFQGAGLARRFSSALLQVEKLNEELETRVEERTRDLELEKEHALEASNAKSQFLSVMAHEIRTPLHVILGNVRLMLEENLTTEQRRTLETVQASSQGLAALLSDVLDLARIEADKLLVQLGPLALREYVEEIAATFRAKAAEVGTSIHLKIASDVPEFVTADRVKLGQILTNLLSNAVKFTSKGTVELSVECAGRDTSNVRVRFTVADTGIGIAADRLEAVFEKFTQEKAEVGQRYGGTGLGLSIVQGLVSLLDGTVRAESRQGVGSRFIVELPFVISQEPPLPQPKLADVSLQGLRVLAAEDNPDNVALMRRMFQRFGAELTIASNGVEAVELCRNNFFDVVLMDLQMPLLDGFGAAKQIIEEAASAGRTPPPIVALTAAAVPEIRERAFQHGIRDFQTKPVDPDELRALLAKYKHG
ncbi:MAG: response regulator [Spirochaetia bacterium]|nr:response regulator [Spirochaetia bacterium]